MGWGGLSLLSAVASPENSVRGGSCNGRLGDRIVLMLDPIQGLIICVEGRGRRRRPRYATFRRSRRLGSTSLGTVSSNIGAPPRHIVAQGLSMLFGRAIACLLGAESLASASV